MNARLDAPIGAPHVDHLAAVRALLLARATAIGVAGADEASRIEALLDREVAMPEPTEEECHRFYDNHPEHFTAGELVAVRHILFAVVPGVPVDALARTAEKALVEVRADPERFAEIAKQFSNCPSGQHGGNLGQLQRGETVPEFERAVFSAETTGILPRLVNTRYGFHIIALDERAPGKLVPFAAVKESIAARLVERVRAKALVQYVRLLAAEAGVDGLPFDAASSPLVQ